MASTDFFDDDLIKQRDAAKKIRLGGASDEPVGSLSDAGDSDEVPVRPVSDFNLTRMAKHKHEVNEQMATAMQELERLRKRQEDLEREKRELEEMRRKQQDYDAGKREMIGRLNESLIHLEKREMKAEQLCELLGSTRKRFKALQGDIESLSEEAWPEDQVRDELGKALAVLDDARLEYNKAMAKIDAITGDGQASESSQPSVMFEDRRAHDAVEKNFLYWFKAGAAFTLPLMAFLLVISLVYFILNTMALM